MAETTAKERVEQELEELNEKITKLTAFLYGSKIITADLSNDMRFQMKRQLLAMQEYANALQHRLHIWGKSNRELAEIGHCNTCNY